NRFNWYFQGLVRSNWFGMGTPFPSFGPQAGKSTHQAKTPTSFFQRQTELCTKTNAPARNQYSRQMPQRFNFREGTLASLCPFFRLYGFAFGAKNPIGKSREVRNPAGELRITGIELTATLAVAMSPCEPPGIVSEIFG